MCLPWALLLVVAPGSCAGRWRMGLYEWAPVCSPLRSPVNTVPGSQAESLRVSVSCLWCFSDLPTAPLHTHAHHSLHIPPPRTQTPVHLTVIHPNWHRAEHLRDPASPLPARPQVLPCQDHRSQRAHQHAPAQRVILPSSPTSLHMEMRATGIAQEWLQWRQGLVWPALV